MIGPRPRRAARCRSRRCSTTRARRSRRPYARLRYDTLVIAIGSLTNDFGTPGVQGARDRARDRRRGRAFPRAAWSTPASAPTCRSEPLRPHQVTVAIIGAGATGVGAGGRAAQGARACWSTYGLDRIDPEQRHPDQPDRGRPPHPAARCPSASPNAAAELLKSLGMQGAHAGTKVSAVRAERCRVADGAHHAGRARGVGSRREGARRRCEDLDGLETNRAATSWWCGRRCRPRATTTMFAIGDCAACAVARPSGTPVPPRAQAAHQQASHLAGQLPRRLRGEPLKPWRYRDFGSLGVARRAYSTVGSLMGSASWAAALWVERPVLQRANAPVHRVVQTGDELAVQSAEWRGNHAAAAIARLLRRAAPEPRVKLH